MRNSLSSIPSGGIGLVLFLQKNYNLLSLGIGEPDFKTPDHIIEAAVESLRSGMTHYSPDEGLYALRLAILEKTQRNNGFGFDPDSQVVVTSGTSPAISGAIFVSVDPGDDVVIPTPTYLGYEPMVRLAGAHPVFVPSAEENGFIPTQDEISDAITSKTKMIIVSSPCNPTGAVWDRDSLKAVADLATDHDLLVLSDELYERIVFDGFRAHSIAAMDGMFDRTITINGVSKSHAMTGFRVGWLIAPKHIVDAYLKIHRYNAVCAPVPCQAAATAALTGPDDAVKQMVSEYNKRKDLLVSRINNDVPFVSTIGSKGGLFVFANVNELADLHRQTMISLLTHGSGKSFLGQIPSELVNLHDLSGSDSQLVMLYFAHAAGVLTTSGAFFGAGGDGYLRLSIAQSSDKIDLAVDKIAEALTTLE